MTDAKVAELLSKVEQSGSCWMWIGPRQRSGYGRMSVHGAKLAHRLAYEYFIGPIPVGMEIDHLCRNRACVNPMHLDAVSHVENVRRGARCAASVAFAPHTPETRELIRQGLRGIPKTREHRAHLFASQRARRAKERALKTHCGNGHPWIPENVWNGPRGVHACRRCGAEAKRRRYARAA